LGAGFVAECGDDSSDGREEMTRFDRACQPVTFDLLTHRVLAE
jgi:hypothetical protein